MDQQRRQPRRTNACGLFSAVVAVLATIAVACLPRASAFGIVLGSFQNSSLWRERYASDSGAHRQHQPDYYDVLGVRTNASKEDIKMAFRRLVKTYHPGTYIITHVRLEVQNPSLYIPLTRSVLNHFLSRFSVFNCELPTYCTQQ